MNRCLILMPVLFQGGSEKQVRLIIDGIENKNFPLTVVVESNDSNLTKQENEYVKSHPNTRFVFLGSDTLDSKFTGRVKKYTAKLKSLWRLSKIMIVEIKQRNVETVMVTNLTGLVLTPLFKHLGCNVIYNERNPGVKVCDSVLKRCLLKRCKKLVCNSKFASSYMSKALGEDVEVINNGIHKLTVVNTPEADGVYRIIVPARVTGVKNQMVILQALSKLNGCLNVKVTFAGVFEDEEYYHTLLDYVKEHNLEECVNFIGFTSDMEYYYKYSDLLILPSLEEGTPNVLLEAFMCRLSVLASDIPMNADCIQDSRCIFGVNNSEELAQKIRWMNELNQCSREKMLDENYRFVNENYGIERMQNRYLNLLYQE